MISAGVIQKCFAQSCVGRYSSGSGLSSSAAFSVLIGKILSDLFNDGKVDPVVIARAAQESENRFFGKPCGLMDQLACSLGHCVYVDFKINEIVPITADFSDMGLTLCLTDTGGSHELSVCGVF